MTYFDSKTSASCYRYANYDLLCWIFRSDGSITHKVYYVPI